MRSGIKPKPGDYPLLEMASADIRISCRSFHKLCIGQGLHLIRGGGLSTGKQSCKDIALTGKKQRSEAGKRH